MHTIVCVRYCNRLRNLQIQAPVLLVFVLFQVIKDFLHEFRLGKRLNDVIV